MFINSRFPCFLAIHLIFSEGKIFPLLIYIYFKGFRLFSFTHISFVLGRFGEKRNSQYLEQLCPNTPEYKGRFLLNKRKLNTTEEKNLFFFEKIKYIFTSIHLVSFLSTNLLIYLKQSVTINFRFIITTLVSNEDVWGGSGVERNFSCGKDFLDFPLRTSFRGSFYKLHNDFSSLLETNYFFTPLA